MKVTATQLRAELYRILDRVAKTGEEVEIKRPSGTVVIRAKPAERKARRRPARGNPKLIVGDPDSLVHVDWSKYWKPIL